MSWSTVPHTEGWGTVNKAGQAGLYATRGSAGERLVRFDSLGGAAQDHAKLRRAAGPTKEKQRIRWGREMARHSPALILVHAVWATFRRAKCLRPESDGSLAAIVGSKVIERGCGLVAVVSPKITFTSC